jgi:hypothetical protein
LLGLQCKFEPINAGLDMRHKAGERVLEVADKRGGRICHDGEPPV